MMTVKNITNVLKMMGVDAYSGEYTIVIKYKNKKIDIIEIHEHPDYTRVELIRDGSTKCWNYGKNEMTDYYIFRVVMDIVGGLV